MRRKKTPSLEELLDRDIEREYYKQATGRQINIMKIRPFFAACRNEVMQHAVTVADAVHQNIERFCEPVKEATP